MPIIYLSPSTQEWNPYITGGTEEYYMNQIADAMIPYLRSCGIRYVRNTPEMTAASSIAASNAGNFDLHLALHSNASPESIAGQRTGSEVYYDSRSWWGQKAAEIIAANLKAIYPDPNNVRTLTTTSLGEVNRTRAPAVLIEFAYHDNIDRVQRCFVTYRVFRITVYSSETGPRGNGGYLRCAFECTGPSNCKQPGYWAS